MPVEEHALILADVVPVTDTVAPTLRSDTSVVLALTPVETKMVLLLAVNRKPSMEPFPV